MATYTISISGQAATALRIYGCGAALEQRRIDALSEEGMLSESGDRLSDWGRAALCVLINDDGHITGNQIQIFDRPIK